MVAKVSDHAEQTAEKEKDVCGLMLNTEC